MLSVAVSLVGGLLFGYLFLNTGVKDTLDLILMSALDVMIFIAGIEIGSNRGILNASATCTARCWRLPYLWLLPAAVFAVHCFWGISPG